MFSFLVVQIHSISVVSLCYDNLMNLYHVFQFLHQPRLLHRPRQIQPTPLCPMLLVCYCHYNKLQQNWWLKTTQIFYFIVLNVRCPKWVLLA